MTTVSNAVEVEIDRYRHRRIRDSKGNYTFPTRREVLWYLHRLIIEESWTPAKEQPK